jgi:hypothetical protein
MGNSLRVTILKSPKMRDAQAIQKCSIRCIFHIREVLVKLTLKRLEMRRIYHTVRLFVFFLVNSSPLHFYWRSDVEFILACFNCPQG